MGRLFVCFAALGFLTCAPALSEDNSHRGDNHAVAAPEASRGSANSRKDEHGPGIMRQNTKGDARSRPNGGHQNAIGAGAPPGRTRNAGTHQNNPAAGSPPNQYLPASGDVHPYSSGRPTVDRSRNNSGWFDNGNNQQPVVNPNRSKSVWNGNTAIRNDSRNELRRNMQASRRFHGGSYIAPQGYQHRHWSSGQRLPQLYYARDYWIGNFVMFGLFAPPSDLVWVRVGEDALLIDRDTGEIVQVRYGFFY